MKKKATLNRSDPTIRRLAEREGLAASALDSVSSFCHQVFGALQDAHNEIKALAAENMLLCSKLQREYEIRRRLEGALTSLAIKHNELYNAYNPPNKPSNKVASKVLLWLLERCLKEHGFCIPRMINDLRAKLIIAYTAKKPIQKGFGLPEAFSREEIEKAVEGKFDMFEDWQ